MGSPVTLESLTEDMAEAVPPVDAETEGQYGNGLGSENEVRQIELVLEYLCNVNDRYQEVETEVLYPDGSKRCDLVMPNGMPVEAKLIRYWRANGDPEPNMYERVFSPFHRNTLLTDADRLRNASFGEEGALLGLFYVRSEDDPKTVEALNERYTAESIGEKIVLDLDYWYGLEASVCEIARFDGLQHDVHKRGAIISWTLEQ